MLRGRLLICGMDSPPNLAEMNPEQLREFAAQLPLWVSDTAHRQGVMPGRLQFTAGLAALGLLRVLTRPRSPHVNGRQEAW